MVDITRIMEIIPHRYPFLLIDKVVDIVKGESAVGIKNVTYNEPFFPGHFPSHPIMPGVLIVEAMAQAAAVLVVESEGSELEGKLIYFTSIEKARFRRPVKPGDTLRLHVSILQNRKNIWKFDVWAEVDGQKTTEATISAMIMD